MTACMFVYGPFGYIQPLTKALMSLDSERLGCGAFAHPANISEVLRQLHVAAADKGVVAVTITAAHILR